MKNVLDLIKRSPESLSAGKLYPHAILRHGDTENEARNNPDRWKMSLNGTWDFTYWKSPVQADVDAKPKHKITVPGCWDMMGFGSPNYTNVNMPFTMLPPEFPVDDNPTGLYSRTFTLPKDWSGRRTVLHFDGVENFFAVFLNGELLGYSKNSRGASEFEITNKLKKGKNLLKVLVTKYSDASFVEDQDEWWHAGIVRNVYLLSMPEEHLSDVFAKTTLGEKFTDGVLAIEAIAAIKPNELYYEHGTVATPHRAGERYTFVAKVYDGKKLLASTECVVGQQKGDDFNYVPIDTGRMYSKFPLNVENVTPWSAENPKRYNLVVTLNKGKEVVDATSIMIGFRRVEIRHRQLLINDKPVLICGVNRHEHNSRTGRTLTVEDVKRDLELMKQFNINAIRTCHYPDMPEFYDLCDEYGFYVVDEANIESHAFYSDLMSNPQWAGAFLSRGIDLVMRDKNHPCVIAWSLGNESGCGENHASEAAWIRRYDDSRALMYEPAICTPKPIRFKTNINTQMTDVIAPMYPFVKHIISWATYGSDDERPFIMCEYSHAMGNSNGGLADYFKAFRTHYGLQGGFIWEWCDHGIWKKGKDGKEFIAYGGDFGEKIHDYNFVTDGLMSPDRIPHPAMYEMKKLSQPASFTLCDASTGLVKVMNLRYFTGLSDCRLVWELAVNGETVQTGKIELPEMQPQGLEYSPESLGNQKNYSFEAKNEFFTRIPYKRPENLCLGDVCTLLVKLVQKKKTIWCNAGHVTAYEQFEVPFSSIKMPEAVKVKTLPDDWAEIFTNGQLNVWHPTTDNELIKRWSMHKFKYGAPCFWMMRGWDKLTLDKMKSTKDGVVCSYKLGDSVSTITETRKVVKESNGSLTVRSTIVLSDDLKDMPELSYVFALPEKFNLAEYFGLGPFENYCDRKAAAILGKFKLSSDEPCPYVMPQDYGGRSGVRNLVVTDGKKRFRIVPELPVTMSFRPYRNEDMQAAEHWHEVKRSGKNFLILAIARRGVSTASCGPDNVNDYCPVNGGTYEFSFNVSLLA